MYANTRFVTGVDEWGQVAGTIEPGDEVSKNDLNVSDDEWNSLCERNLIVEEYPEELKNDPGLSPTEFYMQEKKRKSATVVEEIRLPVPPKVQEAPKSETPPTNTETKKAAPWEQASAENKS